MKTKIGVIIILCLLAILIGNIVQKTMGSEEIKGYEEDITTNKTNIQKDQIAPNLVVQNLQGETVELSDFKGKNVVLNFWTTWCPPCKEEMPHLENYYEKYKEKQNVEIVAINLTYLQDSEQKVKDFVEKNSLTFPVLLTQQEEINIIYNLANIPTTFFLDEEGNIQRKITGPLNEKSLHHYVNDLIKN